MPTLTRLSALSAAALLAFAGLAAQPQPGTKGPPSPSAQPAPTPVGEKGPALEKFGEKSPEGARFDLEFKGGTIAEYLQLLRGMPGARVNVALAEEAEGLPLGQIVLKQATFESAIQAVETARMVQDGQTIAARLQQQNGMFLVNVSKTVNQSANPFERPSEMQVFNLSGASAPTTPAEVVLSAVEAAVRLVARPGEEPKISYHKESGLLFVMGSDRVQDAVRNVYRSIGERREATATKATLDGCRELCTLLSAPDLAAAITKVRELLQGREAADHARILAATSEAKLATQAQMAQEEIVRLRERLDKTEDEIRKSEAVARQMSEQMRKHNEDLGAANQKLADELKRAQDALRAAERAPQPGAKQ